LKISEVLAIQAKVNEKTAAKSKPKPKAKPKSAVVGNLGIMYYDICIY